MLHTGDSNALNLVLACAAGIALAAACGLRAFLPLLALGVGARLGLLHLRPDAAALAGDTAIWMLVVATVVELIADKVPALDHALDVLATFVRPAAAALVAWAVFPGLHPALALAASLVLGAGAFGIHAVKAKTRVASSVLTLGTANPFLSFVEDGLAATFSALALLAPLLALALVALGGWLLYRALHRMKRPAASAPPPGS